MSDQISAKMRSLGIEGNSEVFETVQKVRYGMSLDEVNRIIGSEGESEDLSDKPSLKGMEMLTWHDPSETGFYTLTVMMKGGTVENVFYYDGPNSYGDNNAKRTVNGKTVEQRR